MSYPEKEIKEQIEYIFGGGLTTNMTDEILKITKKL